MRTIVLFVTETGEIKSRMSNHAARMQTGEVLAVFSSRDSSFSVSMLQSVIDTSESRRQQKRQKEGAAVSVQHTPEPWRFDPRNNSFGSNNVYGPPHADGGNYAALFRTSDPADGERAVACVNALAGLNPEAVKDVVPCIEKLGRIVGSIHYHDNEKKDVLLTNEQWTEIEQVFCVLAALRPPQ